VVFNADVGFAEHFVYRTAFPFSIYIQVISRKVHFMSEQVEVVLAYFGSQHRKFHAAGRMC
jgi:hypothetical protein